MKEKPNLLNHEKRMGELERRWGCCYNPAQKDFAERRLLADIENAMNYIVDYVYMCAVRGVLIICVWDLILQTICHFLR